MLQALFSDPSFSLATMLDKINSVPLTPKRIGDMGLFRARPISTTTVQMDSEDAILTMINDTPRGAPAQELETRKGKNRYFGISRFPIAFGVTPDEIQNVRQLGTAQALRTMQTIRDQKATDASRAIDTTLEYQRMGAVQGIILDASGSTKYNLFDEFDITQDTVAFALGTTTTIVMDKVKAAKRLIELALGDGAVYDHIHVFCGATFFDKLTAHVDVQQKYINWQAAQDLRTDNRKGFTYGGMVFEEYVGKVGSTDFIAADEAHAFPVGVDGLFETAFGPANHMETVNTMGLPKYMFSEILEMGQGVRFLAESNPFSFCRKPKVLLKFTTN